MRQIYRFRFIVFAIPFAFSVISLSANTTEYLFSVRMVLSLALSIVLLHNVLCGVRLRYVSKGTKGTNEIGGFPSGWLSKENAKSFFIINGLLYLSATWFINLWVFLAAPIILLILVFFQFHRPKRNIRKFFSTYWPSLIPIALWFLITESANLVPSLLSAMIFFATWGYIRFSSEENIFTGTVNWKNKSLILSLLSVIVAMTITISQGYGWAGYLATILFGLILSTPYMAIAPLKKYDAQTVCLCIYLLAAVVFNAIIMLEWKS